MTLNKAWIRGGKQNETLSVAITNKVGIKVNGGRYMTEIESLVNLTQSNKLKLNIKNNNNRLLRYAYGSDGNRPYIHK